MANKPAPRRRGPPSMWDASKRPAYLDRMGAEAIRAINEEAMGTPEKRAADTAMLRGHILRAVRKRRHLKPIEANLSKADRLQRLEQLLNESQPRLSALGSAVLLKKKSAASTALILKNRGLFLEVELDTLRKDIALLRKLARPS